MNVLASSFPRGSRIRLLLLGLTACAASLFGCGGAQDYGSFSRGLGGDIGNGYNTSLGSRYRSAGEGQSGGAGAGRGAYPMLETSFELASVPGDPFDFEKVNVQVTLRKPDGGTTDVPAFFDGGTTWRMRYTPLVPGQYSVVSVKLNRETAHEEKLEKKEWTVNGDPQPGFVRVDRGDHNRFVFDDGSRYYPLGHNQAWNSKDIPSTPERFAKMHEAGENWSRVWMTFWDGKALDWPQTGKPDKLGDFDLKAAKQWDEIVQGAEKNGIYFQMTIQHHGQFSSEKGYANSSNVNPNWDANPYSDKNGGPLGSPEAFFTNPQARALTRRKLYYILARWGYSPNIMGWELFNEVEGTDAAHGKLWDDIAMWHREMALFLRQFDRYQHLITTSSAPGVAPNSPLWDTVDYIQYHGYPPDVIAAMGSSLMGEKGKRDKPAFFGEFGAQNLADAEGVALHTGLWSSMMSGASGAAEYWDWENVEKHDLYSHYRAASGFMTASGFPGHGGLLAMPLTVETSQKAALRFGPGGGWENAAVSEFVVGANGVPAGMDRFPAYFQGQNHRAMMPKPLTFQVNYPQPGAFAVNVATVSKGGGHIKITVDNGKSVERDYPASDSDHAPKSDQAITQAEVPAGAHTVTVENTGSDWVVVRQFVLANYTGALAANARVGKDYAVAWVYHRANVDAPASEDSSLTPTSGTLSLPGLKAGAYRATWWDTRAGKSLSTSDFSVGKEGQAATLTTPLITRDVALYVTKAGTAPENTARKSRPQREKAGASAAAGQPNPRPLP